MVTGPESEEHVWVQFPGEVPRMTRAQVSARARQER